MRSAKAQVHLDIRGRLRSTLFPHVIFTLTREPLPSLRLSSHRNIIQPWPSTMDTRATTLFRKAVDHRVIHWGLTTPSTVLVPGYAHLPFKVQTTTCADQPQFSTQQAPGSFSSFDEQEMRNLGSDGQYRLQNANPHINNASSLQPTQRGGIEGHPIQSFPTVAVVDVWGSHYNPAYDARSHHRYENLFESGDDDSLEPQLDETPYSDPINYQILPGTEFMGHGTPSARPAMSCMATAPPPAQHLSPHYQPRLRSKSTGALDLYMEKNGSQVSPAHNRYNNYVEGTLKDSSSDPVFESDATHSGQPQGHNLEQTTNVGDFRCGFQNCTKVLKGRAGLR